MEVLTLLGGVARPDLVSTRSDDAEVHQGRVVPVGLPLGCVHFELVLKPYAEVLERAVADQRPVAARGYARRLQGYHHGRSSRHVERPGARADLRRL